MRKSLFQLFVAIFALANLPQSSQAQEQSLALGTGAEGGVYFEFGSILAEQMSADETTELSIQVVSTDGSVDNLHKMRDGTLDMAIVQNDIAYYVYEGNHGYQSFQEFEAGIPLFEEYVQVLVHTGSNIRALGELEHRTVSLGPPGSGSYHNAIDLMNETGLRPGVEFEAVYLDVPDGLAQLISGEIDAVINTGALVPSTRTGDLQDIRVLSLSREIVNSMALRSPYYVAATPAFKLGESTIEVSTVSVLSFLVFSDRVSDAHALNIVRLIDENATRFHATADNRLVFASILDTNTRKPVPLNSGVHSYLVEKQYISSSTNHYWAVLFGLFLIGLVIYAQIRCSAYDRLGNVRSASGTWTYRLMLAFSRFNTLIIVIVVFVFVLLALVESIQFFEAGYAREHNIRNQFADTGFWDAVLWMFMFMGSGHTENIFPLSGPGRVLATVLPFLGIGGVLGFSLLGLDETRARSAARKRGRLPTKAKNHVLVCGWNEKAKGIVYGLTSDDVPRKKHVVVVADIDGDMPLDNHDFDARYVSYQRGDSADHAVLARANIKQADAAVVVAGIKKRSGKNVRSILSVMALKESYTKANAHDKNMNDSLFVAAELLYDENRPIFHACGADAVITAEVVADRMAAQCCVSNHIVDFVLDALTYDDRSELYSTRVGRIGKSRGRLRHILNLLSWYKRRKDKTPPLVGMTLHHARQELAKYGVNVVGIARSRKYDQVLIDDVFGNGHYKFPQDPDSEHVVLTAEHVLLFFADDHSDVHYAAIRSKRHAAIPDDDDRDLRANIAINPQNRRILLVGDLDRCLSVKNILKSVPWCTVTVLTESIPSDRAVEDEIVVGGLSDITKWQQAGLLNSDQITILVQSGERTNEGQNFDDHGEIDARAIFTARFARRFYKTLCGESGPTDQQPVIAAEMLGHKSRQLFIDAEVDVIVPSSLLVERMLTKLVYSKGSVCRFLMALLAFDDDRHILTITLREEEHSALLNKSFEELMAMLPREAQLLGILPGNPDEREKFINPVEDFDYHLLTVPDSSSRRYKSKADDELVIILDRRSR